MFSVDRGVHNVNQPSHLCTQRPKLSQCKHEMTSQILKISGNCGKMNAVRNFKNSAFSDIIYPFILPTRVYVAINCFPLLFYKTFAYLLYALRCNCTKNWCVVFIMQAECASARISFPF